MSQKTNDCMENYIALEHNYSETEQETKRDVPGEAGA